MPLDELIDTFRQEHTLFEITDKVELLKLAERHLVRADEKGELDAADIEALQEASEAPFREAFLDTSQGQLHATEALAAARGETLSLFLALGLVQLAENA